MRWRSRTLGSFLHLQALFLALSAVGAPVLPDETLPAPALSELSTDFGRVAPAGASTLQNGAPPSNSIPRLAATPGGRQNSDVAATAESAASQPPGQAPAATLGPARAKAAAPRPQTDANSVASGLSIDDGLDPELKEAAKTALQWIQEAKERIQPTGASQGFEAADGSAPTGGAVEPSGNIVSTPGRREYQPTFQQGNPIGPPTGAELDLIREAIKLVKEVAWHPLTWLLMALVALGSAAAGVMQHRAHAARRRFRRYATRGQRGSWDRGGRRRDGRSGSAAGISASVRRADEKPVRSKLRRTAKPQ